MSVCGPAGGKGRFAQLQWLFPVAVTLHNAEEAIWLPSWVARHSAQLPWHVPAVPFRLALAALTAIAYMLTLLSRKRGLESGWTYAFLGYVVAMFLNVFVPHVPATILFRGYTPGVVTAVVLNLPVTALLLARAFQQRVLPNRTVTAFVLGVPLAIALSFALLIATLSR